MAWVNVRVQDVGERRLPLDATSELLVAWVNVRVKEVGERRLHLDASNDSCAPAPLRYRGAAINQIVWYFIFPHDPGEILSHKSFR